MNKLKDLLKTIKYRINVLKLKVKLLSKKPKYNYGHLGGWGC